MSLPYNHGYSYPPYTPQHQPDQHGPQAYQQAQQSPGGTVVNPPPQLNAPAFAPPMYPQPMAMVNQGPAPELYNVDEHSQAFFQHQHHQYQQHLQQHPSAQEALANPGHAQPYAAQHIQQSRSHDTPPVIYPSTVPGPADSQLPPGQQTVPQAVPYNPPIQGGSFNYSAFASPPYAQYPSHAYAGGPQNMAYQRHSGYASKSKGSDAYSTPATINQVAAMGMPMNARTPFRTPPKFKSEPVVTQSLYTNDLVTAPMAQMPYLNAYKTKPSVYFKPIETKKNSKPRINKIIKSEQLSKKTFKDKRRPPSGSVGEMSIDHLFRHFQEVMKIDTPSSKSHMNASYQLKMKNNLECQLFDLFINSLSKFIDIFLPQEAFKKIVPELALYDETNMILDSMFCLSSLMLQRIMPDRMDPSIPIKYYQQSIKSIRSYLTIPGIETNEKGIISRCLLSTILLCIYELFFVAIDSTYVKGASSILASILSKHNVQGRSLLKSSPFHQTCFWAVFLCDLILSLKFDLPTMYSIETFWKPLDPEYFELFNKYGTQLLSNNVRDRELFNSNALLNKEHTMWWLHKSVINYSCINEFKNQVDVITLADVEANKPYYEWLKLKQLIDEFESSMPISLKPNIYKPSSGSRIFPLIYFKDEVTAIIGLNFKLSKIALYESLISRTDTSDPLVKHQLEQYPAAYAKKLTKDIIGIMKTYDSNMYLWPVNVHTLRQVAHYVSDEPKAHRLLEELVERIISVCNLRLQDKIVRS